MGNSKSLDTLIASTVSCRTAFIEALILVALKELIPEIGTDWVHNLVSDTSIAYIRKVVDVIIDNESHVNAYSALLTYPLSYDTDRLVLLPAVLYLWIAFLGISLARR